jgi:hypothetical protein
VCGDDKYAGFWFEYFGIGEHSRYSISNNLALLYEYTPLNALKV